MAEAQATYETVEKQPELAQEPSEPSERDALLGECRALLDRISQASGIPVVQAQETAPATLQAGTAKAPGPDGQDVPALIIQMDGAALAATALYALLSDAGIVAKEAFMLAALRVKRDILTDIAANIAAQVEARAAQARKLTVAKGPALVLPNGANRAARRDRGRQLTRVRSD